MTGVKDLRVMLLTPQFWISGTVTYARELQRGWPSTWTKPVIMCPTKSGKPSSQWGRPVHAIKRASATAYEPDQVGSPSDIIRVAAESFDVVHVTEPDIIEINRGWWHSLLEDLPIPWSLTLNGNLYHNVDWARITRARNFTGVVWHTPGHVPGELRVTRRPMKILSLPRPYTLLFDVNAQILRSEHEELTGRPIVGTHCRMAPDKGVALVASLARHLNTDVCLDGAPQAGSMPYTLTLQKQFLTENQRVSAESTWTSNPAPGRVHYGGAFSDGVARALYHDVHVSGTRVDFSAGHEYSMLEAVDAGCVIVQPTHMIESDCALDQHVYSWQRLGVVGAVRTGNTELISAVHDALQRRKSWYDQSYNRKLIAEHHSPSKLLHVFMDELLSVI